MRPAHFSASTRPRRRRPKSSSGSTRRSMPKAARSGEHNRRANSKQARVLGLLRRPSVLIGIGFAWLIVARVTIDSHIRPHSRADRVCTCSQDDSARIVEAILETLIQLQDVAAAISVATELMGGQIGNLERAMLELSARLDPKLTLE